MTKGGIVLYSILGIIVLFFSGVIWGIYTNNDEEIRELEENIQMLLDEQQKTERELGKLRAENREMTIKLQVAEANTVEPNTLKPQMPDSDEGIERLRSGLESIVNEEMIAIDPYLVIALDKLEENIDSWYKKTLLEPESFFDLNLAKHPDEYSRMMKPLCDETSRFIDMATSYQKIDYDVYGLIILKLETIYDRWNCHDLESENNEEVIARPQAEANARGPSSKVIQEKAERPRIINSSFTDKMAYYSEIEDYDAMKEAIYDYVRNYKGIDNAGDTLESTVGLIIGVATGMSLTELTQYPSTVFYIDILTSGVSQYADYGNIGDYAKYHFMLETRDDKYELKFEINKKTGQIFAANDEAYDVLQILDMS